MIDARGTLIEAVAEVMHHNRNRPAMMERTMTPEGMRALGIVENERVAASMAAFSLMHTALTPDDETKVIISRLREYMDVETALSDGSHVYGILESMRAMESVLGGLPAWSAIENPRLKSWLNGRGVTDGQILRWGLIDLSRLRDQRLSDDVRIRTGASVHPALRRWIGEDAAPGWVPDGVMTPVFSLSGVALGCHNRLLSTVPKMKFCSSIPNLLLFTNLRKRGVDASGNPFAGHEVTDPEEIYIVEGVFDALAVERAANAAGRKDVGFIAPSTGYWEPEQWMALASMLLEFSSATVVPMFDNDRVGAKSNLATAYAIDEGLGLRSELRRWTKGKDPAEAIVKHGLGLADLERVEWRRLRAEYEAMPYEEFRDYEEYMSGRHASYSNDNYGWEKDKGKNC